MRIKFPTQLNRKWLGLAIALPALLTGAAYGQYLPGNVCQPGDPIIASSANSPSTEGVANAIDGTTAKYLNFDAGVPGDKPVGFVVTPSLGPTWVFGISMETANDAKERDPKEITLEGSNDDPSTVSWTSTNWTMIVDIPNIPAITNRYTFQTFYFTNYAVYRSYRWTVLSCQGPNQNSMQTAEVQLLGTAVPKNVAQPGDQIFASSANSPSTEGVANAIDGTTAKYLNFDAGVPGDLPVGFAFTPSVGATLINGISMETANDAKERDPKEVTVEGSNDPTITGFTGGSWTLIAHLTNIPAITNRYTFQTFLFPNSTPYLHYRWTVLACQGPNQNSMQTAEVQFLGASAPQNVVVPSDQIFASSANSPSTEGVANAIDGTTAKYLNFDAGVPGDLPVGFAVTPSVGPTVIVGLGMETANDAKERDPKEVTIEGSNDDTITGFSGANWTQIVDIANIPAVTNRYFWQYFYFTNQLPYKHYRWTVLSCQGPNQNSMQTAEVQLLAVTAKADCSKAAFISTPTDTPALAGSSAQFLVDLNGPWPLQWYVNGAAVPGATKTTFSTDPLSAAVATNVYTVAIVGCQTSPPVHAVLFIPSATKSIGIQFGGGGANGTPEYMNTNDIAGVQVQAYWNVATTSTGSIGDPNNPSTTVTNALGNTDFLTDSSGNTNSISFTYATSATWGAGVSFATPNGRMLGGTVGQGGVGGADQIMTFHNVPPGTNALLIYAISPPLQIQNVHYTVTNGVSTTYYVRVMNSSEYNPAPGFYRATSTSSSSPSIANFIRFDGVQADVNGDVNLVFNVTGVSADNVTGANAIQLVLNAPNPGSPPVITQEPQPTVAPAGGTATVTVTATGTGLSYQWRKNGVNISNGGDISGATTATLKISPMSAADVGIYSVAVFSPAGSVVSANASVAISKYNIQDGLLEYWKFDATSGTNAVNSATNGLVGSVYGVTNWGPGKVGGALTFDGGTTFMFVSNYTKPTAAMAAAAWVNVPAAGPYTIIRNSDGPITVTDGQFSFGLNADVSGNAVVTATVVVGAKIITVTSTATFPLASWHHVAFTADGAQVRLFIDGQQVGSTDYLGALTTSSVPSWLSVGASLATDTTQTPPVIGPDPAAANMLIGSLDELALWNRSLSASEVTAIFTAGTGGKGLDTVVETPPATGGGTLKASVAAGKITVTWTSGTLQSAAAITGQWTDVTGATGGSFTEAVAAGAKFYRTR
jgi:hypothetical protein